MTAFTVTYRFGTINSLDGLKNIYLNMQTMTAGIAERLRTVTVSESSSNALINLDIFANNAPYMINDSLEEIRYLFDGFPALIANRRNEAPLKEE